MGALHPAWCYAPAAVNVTAWVMLLSKGRSPLPLTSALFDAVVGVAYCGAWVAMGAKVGVVQVVGLALVVCGLGLVAQP